MTKIVSEQEPQCRSETKRDEVLKRWVKQPPADPYTQYLRDAERLAALEQLGKRDIVLDVASEANVTRGLDAESVTRLDFSSAASDYARQSLNQSVDSYALTDPEWPQLPFDNSEFDAAVSIGPFDWKFLDADGLLDELHRVVKDAGHFVFSVPTPRSPYSKTDSYRFRYYTPAEAHRFVPPDWRLIDYNLLFQYPSPAHTVIGRLPEDIQEPFVDIAWRFSDQLTTYDRWDLASYLVLGIEPLDYDSYLETALECLFRPVEENGFWDTQGGKIIRALNYTFDGEQLLWRPDDRIKWRYAPFALMGVMHWRTSVLGTEQYDEKIRCELEYFVEHVEERSTLDEMPSYGIGPLITSFVRAAETFDDSQYGSIGRRLYEYSSAQFDFTHAEDSLLVSGWSHLYRYDPDDKLRADIAKALWSINEQLSTERLFRFENPTTLRHQNQMYTLWGLCDAVEVTGATGYLDSAEQVLDYTIEHRMRDDGAFIWDDVSQLRRLKGKVITRAGGRPRRWEFLYECHQTFFVNAVMRYYAAGGTKNYDREMREAMSWIYGDNKIGTNLVQYSGLGVPMRQMTTDGRMTVSDQMYKGAYEIGSYIMALTDLLKT